MLGFNLSVGRNRQSFGDADAQAFIAATGLTGTTETTAVRRLVANLKTYGLWSKMKAIYPFVSDTINLLSYTEDFTNGAWSKANSIIVTGNTTTAPDGTNTADTLTNATGQISRVRQQINTSIGQTITFSVWVKCASGTVSSRLNIEEGSTGFPSSQLNFTTTTTWQRVSLTRTLTGSGTTSQFDIWPDTTLTGQSIFVWGAQTELSSSATTYQPIATTPANRFVSQFKYNLKDPRDLDAAFRLAFNGTWTYSKQGATPNGVNGYANTYLNPVAQGLTTASAHLSYYARTSASTSDPAEMGNYTNNSVGFVIQSRSSLGTSLYYYSYPIGASRAVATAPTGLMAGSSIANTRRDLYLNGVSVANNTSTDNGTLGNYNLYIGAANINNTSAASYTNSQTGFSSIGNGLTDSEMANYYTSVQTFNQDLSRQVGVPIVSDSDAQSFLNAAVITDTTQANAINTLVVGLKNASLWTKMKAIYPFVGGTATTHKWNLKDPRDLDAAYRLAFSGAWTHSSTGALPNGANAFANTYLNPTTTFADKPLGIGAYVNTVSTFTNDKHIIGAYSGASNYSSIQVNSSTAMQFNMYAGFTATLSASPSARGYMLWTNNGTTAYAYVNNQSTSGTLNGTNRPNVNYSLGGINVNGTTAQFVNNQFCAGYITDYLTSTESNNFYTLLQSFQTTLGRQV